VAAKKKEQVIIIGPFHGQKMLIYSRRSERQRGKPNRSVSSRGRKPRNSSKKSWPNSNGKLPSNSVSWKLRKPPNVKLPKQRDLSNSARRLNVFLAVKQMTW